MRFLRRDYVFHRSTSRSLCLRVVGLRAFVLDTEPQHGKSRRLARAALFTPVAAFAVDDQAGQSGRDDAGFKSIVAVHCHCLGAQDSAFILKLVMPQSQGKNCSAVFQTADKMSALPHVTEGILRLYSFTWNRAKFFVCLGTFFDVLYRFSSWRRDRS